MNRRTYQPTTYVVRWGDVWKAGFTTGKRWRSFELRGADVVSVTTYTNGLDALAAENLIESWLSHLGHPAFQSKDDAAPWLGNQGGGWTECYCLCDVGPSQSGRFCDSQSGIPRSLPRATPTYGTYETDEESVCDRANLMSVNARASRGMDLRNEAAVEQWAARLAGCVLVDWYCDIHNLSWVMCRWMNIASVVHRAYRQGWADAIAAPDNAKEAQ
jgi:hypothetical protein